LITVSAIFIAALLGMVVAFTARLKFNPSFVLKVWTTVPRAVVLVVVTASPDEELTAVPRYNPSKMKRTAKGTKVIRILRPEANFEVGLAD